MRRLINNITGVTYPFTELLARQPNIRQMTHSELVERGLTPKGEVAKRVGDRMELPPYFNETTNSDLQKYVVENKLKTSLNVNKPVVELREEVQALVREYNKDFTDAIETMPETLPEHFYDKTVRELRAFAEAPGGHLKPIDLNGLTKKSTIQEKIIQELKYQERQDLDTQTNDGA